MAKTLMVRPYVFAASSRAASGLFLRQAQPTRLFVSAVLFNRTRATCAKLQAHNYGNNCIGEAYGYGRSLGFGFGFGPVSGRRFSTRATNVNDAGFIDSPLMHSMEKKIKEHLDAESVTVRDAYGDGRHVSNGLFGWGGFGPRDLDLRAQIQIFCLDDLKSFGFGFGPNPSWISKAQIHGFQMTCIARNLGNPPPHSVPLARASLTQSHSRQLSGFQVKKIVQGQFGLFHSKYKPFLEDNKGSAACGELCFSTTKKTHARLANSKHIVDKMNIVEVIGEIGSSLKDYCSSLKEYLAKKNQEQSQPSGEEIRAVVSKVPGLTQYEMFKIIDKLMHGGAEDFKFLKTLPDDEKMGWIQFKLDPN